MSAIGSIYDSTIGSACAAVFFLSAFFPSIQLFGVFFAVLVHFPVCFCSMRILINNIQEVCGLVVGRKWSFNVNVNSFEGLSSLCKIS